MSAAKKPDKKSFLNINRIKLFLTKKIWNIQLKDYPLPRRLLYHTLRILMLAYRGFVEDRVILRASALTYFTLMSIVPILAMGFGIAKGFGVDKYLEKQLLENFEGQQEILSQVISFSNNLLKNTGGGLIAGIGVIVLFYSVLKVFNHIEHSFNDIWQIKTSRPYARKFADYLSMMLIAPVLLIAASGINVFATTHLTNLSTQIELIGYVTPFIMFLLKFLPYLIIWVAFTLLYIVMPNTKVNVLSGIIAGIIAGSAFMVTQWVYIDFQVGVSRFNAIYGSFAALPLFLAWLRISWLIVLFGAEISFSHQNQNRYEFEAETETISNKSSKALSILILSNIISRFTSGVAPFSSQELSKELKLPIRLVQNLLDKLVECNILSMTYTSEPKTPAFQPAQNIDKFTVSYVFNALDNSGASIQLINPTLDRVNDIYKAFIDKVGELDENLMIKNI
ncbi:MAG: YihY/virulence factor BrkB family protein [Bacteroidales bacterium]|jgi:membrane protein|nr:YihY/virulence factor BrkB family protein [Bacteroidales bacterium]MDD4384414.1 YihY/virulence factor BrkB family protein [Bacteroidales bacterium]MDY0196591.1 YihY/virulence factor BrkB family protein [Tenuifilaceae bacterium]